MEELRRQEKGILPKNIRRETETASGSPIWIWLFDKEEEKS